MKCSMGLDIGHDYDKHDECDRCPNDEYNECGEAYKCKPLKCSNFRASATSGKAALVRGKVNSCDALRIIDGV